MRTRGNAVTNLSKLWISLKPRRTVLFNIFVCKENVIFSNNVNIRASCISIVNIPLGFQRFYLECSTFQIYYNIVRETLEGKRRRKIL